ncbi:MAG TPA: c-type cytochrome [Puia sp.]|nr:c-type cytochrome [Puia sp.]
MKKYFVICSFLLISCTVLLQVGCNNQPPAQQPAEPAKKELSQAELIERGKYLVTMVGCNDCHSPKVMTAEGPVPDTTKLLSGHPAQMPMPPIDKNSLKPGSWILFGPDLTSAVGPWGISFSANLTPDTATGIGAWTEEVFVKTIRTGKHLGQEGGRPILPPMPWQDFGKATDDDLKAIFTYLKALPPIVNKVPAPVAPPDVAKMK